MKNIKIDDKSKFLSAVMLVILLIGIAFFFGYKKFEDKASSISAENANLQTRIASLETYYVTEEQNKKDTERMTKEINDILSSYKGDARYEDGIYEAYNLYGGSMNTLNLESIVFAANETVKTIPSDVVVAADIEGLDSDINFRMFNVSYSGFVTYDGLKGMVREISSGKYNLGIEKMKYSINESSFIEGSSGLSFYYVTGAGLDYKEPPVVDYEKGLENLFGVDGTVVTNEGEEGTN